MLDKVLKFGGSSVAKPERIEQIVTILKNMSAKGETFAVIFSAFGGVTDSLIRMASLAEKGDDSYIEHFNEFSRRHLDAVRSLLSAQAQDKVIEDLKENHLTLKNLLEGILLVREASPRTMDYVLSFGERNSNFIIAALLSDRGLPANYLDARRVIKTDKSFLSAKVDFETTNEKIKKHFSENIDIQVITGFVASAKGGLTTTLGRGGSDYTAAIVGAALNVKAVEIWTDVSGVLTADPRKVKEAFTIEKLTYAEAMEMSHFGAKVIYPPTLVPVLKKNIPLYIKNTFEPEHPGTFISKESDPSGKTIKGISSIKDVALLTLEGSGLFGVPGIAGRLFSTLAAEGINIILITQGSSESSISFAIQPKDAKLAKESIEKHFEYEIKQGTVEPIKVENNLTVLAIIGENMRFQPGIANQLFDALGKNGINASAIAQGSSELNLSVVIDKKDEAKALNAIHQAFFLSDVKVLNIYIVGVGLIGGTLIDQIKNQFNYLLEEKSTEVRIVGLANSRKMYFDENGIDTNNWLDKLNASDDKMDINEFIVKMSSMNLNNSIFVDNTASSVIPKLYHSILDKSISISTPNKVATSSSYADYLELNAIAKKRGVYFRYETNVGAGLPVISTLTDLVQSGDRIDRIEGVLSGSLSFIFNTYDGSIPFSEVVNSAKEKGFTEPDPREDLGGSDVKRKIIILAREAGFKIEPSDVKINSFLSDQTMQADSVDSFFESLKKEDSIILDKLNAAKNKGLALRMVAVFEKGKASIGLQEVDASHPFYSLSGSDNMIVFNTLRYNERPLVVRGPGAGAAVTAAGVFSEVLRIGHLL